MDNKWTINLVNISLIGLIILLWTRTHEVFDPVLKVVGMILGPVIISFFIYHWLRPIVRKLSQGNREKYKGLISLLVLLLFIILIGIIVYTSGSVLVDQFRDVFLDDSGNIINYKNIINKKLNEFDFSPDTIKKLSKSAEKLITSIGNSILRIGSSLADLSAKVILIPFIVFYMLKDEDKFKGFILGIIPRDRRNKTEKIMVSLDKSLSSYIVGQLFVALIIGSLMFLGFVIIKVPNAMLMATFATITSVIPVIGAFLGILPALLIALTIDINLIIKIILVSIIVQQLEGNLITPNIMGSKLSMHPLVVMLVVIASLSMMGIFGAFIGIPLYLVLFTLGKEIYMSKMGDRL